MTLVHQQHSAIRSSVGATGATVHIQNEAGQSRLGWIDVKTLTDPAVDAVTIQLQGRADDTGDWFVLTEITGATSGWHNTTIATFHTIVVGEVPLMPQMRSVVSAGGAAGQFVNVSFGGGEVGR